MNEAIERLRTAIAAERAYSRARPPQSLTLVTDAAVDAVAAITPPAEVKAPADKRDEPVTLGRLDEILQDAWLRAADEGSVAERPLAYLRDTVRRGIR